MKTWMFSNSFTLLMFIFGHLCTFPIVEVNSTIACSLKIGQCFLSDCLNKKKKRKTKYTMICDLKLDIWHFSNCSILITSSNKRNKLHFFLPVNKNYFFFDYIFLTIWFLARFLRKIRIWFIARFSFLEQLSCF